MDNYWKIKNISGHQVKFTVALGTTSSPGVILTANQFCVALPKMTSMLDMQEKRNLVEIDREYSNKRGLELAKAYDETPVDIAEEQIKKYKQS
jgi:hypothetical protein